jgi:hypothetical protein
MPRKKPEPDLICGVCWPDGWPVNDQAASCEHGQWQRTVAELQSAPTPEVPEPPL